jgi:recombination protein RecA
MVNDLVNNDEIKKLFPGIHTTNDFPPVDFVPTPLEHLNNVVLGCGGVPRGRSIELYSAPSEGKTTLAINFCHWYLQQELRAIWDDREGTFPDENYTNGIGLDRDALTQVHTGSGNDALYQFELMAALNLADLWVIDSLAMLLPEGASTVGDTENASMHDKLARASMLTSFFQKLRSGYYIGNPGTVKKDGTYNLKDKIESEVSYHKNGKEDKYWHKLSDKKITLIMINHMKTKPGVRFGDKTSTPGGDATKFDSSLRLRLKYKMKSKEKSKGLPLYKIVSIRADKNKVAPPFGEWWFKFNLDGSVEEFGPPKIPKKLKEENTELEEVTQEDFE